MRRLTAFLSLSQERRRLVCLGLALRILVRIGIRTVSFKKLVAVCERLPVATEDDVTTEDIRWATFVASNLVPGTTCLVRGIVAYTLCRRYGHESELYVGIEPEADDFVAHSWVKSRGEVIVGDEMNLETIDTLGVIAS